MALETSTAWDDIADPMAICCAVPNNTIGVETREAKESYMCLTYFCINASSRTFRPPHLCECSYIPEHTIQNAYYNDRNITKEQCEHRREQTETKY